jgi:hypothetical protein
MAPAPTEVKVTSVPITAPSSTGRLQWRGWRRWRPLARRAAMSAPGAWAKTPAPCRSRGGGREQQGQAQGGGHEVLHPVVAGPMRCSSHSAGQRGRNAARAQQAHHAPGHQALARHAHGAAQLGESGKQQVGANGQVGLDAKEEDQHGRHERAAAHAGQPTMPPTTNPARTKAKSFMGRDSKGPLHVSQRTFRSRLMQISLCANVGAAWRPICRLFGIWRCALLQGPIRLRNGPG